MILPDVNVLLYALRPDAANHAKYHSWIEEVLNGDAAYGMSPQVLSSVIRVATHPGIFKHPTALSEALRFASELLYEPHCQIVEPGPRHWKVFTTLCSVSNVRGNLVPDAWFAALAIESGCEWITDDRDYARFDGLHWRPPF